MFAHVPAPIALEALLAALDHAGIGCTAVLDADGKRTRIYTSEPFAAMLGLERDAAIAHPILESFPPEDRERILTLARSRNVPAGTTFESTLRRADGTTLPVEVRAATVPLP